MNSYGPGNNPEEERWFAIDEAMEEMGWSYDAEQGVWVDEDGEVVKDPEGYLEGLAADYAYDLWADARRDAE